VFLSLLLEVELQAYTVNERTESNMALTILSFVLTLEEAQTFRYVCVLNIILLEGDTIRGTTFSFICLYCPSDWQRLLSRRFHGQILLRFRSNMTQYLCAIFLLNIADIFCPPPLFEMSAESIYLLGGQKKRSWVGIQPMVQRQSSGRSLTGHF